MSNRDEISRIVGEYKYGFRTEIPELMTTGKGLSRETVKKISEIKGEPEWMTETRLKAYEKFKILPRPDFGPDLSFLEFDEYTYYKKVTPKTESSWDDVSPEIKETFDKLGVPAAERKFLGGLSTQFESETVYRKTQSDLEKQGVIFCDTDTALKKYPDLFRRYFGKLVDYGDNKYAALNTAVWSGGSFIYVPKGVKLKKPLQSYFRINSERMGQFERTIIIIEEEASLNYVEGCTAPIYAKDSLHAAVVEIFIKDRGYCRYSAIQNWSNNIVNVVTQKALCGKYAHMEWIDGNIGSMVNMKYPACILAGEHAKGTMISVAFAGKGQHQDTGAKMIHKAPNTSSTIVSKSICRGGGIVNYRGSVIHEKDAENARSHVECDTIILDNISRSETIPINTVRNRTGRIEHEATVSKVSEEQMFYLMSRGLTEEKALEMILMGFIEPFSEELPMEYAVELNRLIGLEMTGAVG